MLETVRYTFQEHKKNWRLIVKLALMDSGKQTVRSSFGILWTYFRDIIFVAVFIIFRLLISGSGNVSGMNSSVYLVTGMVPWFFMNDVLNQGSMAIRANKGIIQNICFPAVILPTISVFSIFAKRIFSFGLVFLVCLGFGYMKYFSVGLFVYYIICMLALMISINLVMTALVTISDDFRQLYEAILRIMIYTMPIIWDFSRVNSMAVHILLRINPMVYVIKGFRDAFVLGPTQDWLYTIYFWGCVIIIFMTGSFLQFRLKKFYADFA